MKGAPSILFIDLKGGTRALKNLLPEALACDYAVDVCNLDPREPSHLWNLFLDPDVKRLSRGELLSIIVNSLGMIPSTGGADKFWSMAQENLARACFTKLTFDSFRQHVRQLDDPRVVSKLGLTPHQFEIGTHYLMEVRAMAEALILNATPADNPTLPVAAFDRMITMRSIFTGRKRLTVFLLPVRQFRVLGPSVAKLLVQIIMAALRLPMEDKRHLVIAIDEANFAFNSNDMIAPLTMGREDGVTFMISAQSPTSKSRGADLSDIILANTQTQIWCSGRDPEAARYLTKHSGEVIEYRQGWSTGNTPKGETNQEMIHEERVPGVSPEMLQRVSNDPELGIVAATPGGGYSRLHRPALFRTSFHICADEYAARMNADLPLLLGQIIAEQYERADQTNKKRADKAQVDDLFRRLNNPNNP